MLQEWAFSLVQPALFHFISYYVMIKNMQPLSS
jgi:hypothetical protein